MWSRVQRLLISAEQIRPIDEDAVAQEEITVNDEGKLIVIGKERGRKKSLMTLVDRMEEKMKGFDNDIVMIVHGDAPEDAEFVKNEIVKRFGITNIMINCLGSVIGSHTGPGVVSIFYMGERN